MQNPWLNIPSSDYTSHMTEVGQAQLLSKLTKESLEQFKPNRFALLGCATGNGLEHINNNITSKVYAIDINGDYLKKCEAQFKDKIPGIETLKLDIQENELNLQDIDLYFIGLVLEYVNPEKALKKLYEPWLKTAGWSSLFKKTSQQILFPKAATIRLQNLQISLTK